jgi:hypothetical protein
VYYAGPAPNSSSSKPDSGVSLKGSQNSCLTTLSFNFFSTTCQQPDLFVSHRTMAGNDATPSQRLPVLDRSKAQIRLLRVLPDRSLGFEVHDIATAPLYHALSYVWQEITDQEGERTINIWHNNYLFTWTVHYNLWSFFQHGMGLLDPGGCLWVDYLCIDQPNVAEKNHQVALMGQIYR